MVYIYELDQNLCNIIGTIFAVKISRKFAKNWWISLDQLLWSTEVDFRRFLFTENIEKISRFWKNQNVTVTCADI